VIEPAAKLATARQLSEATAAHSLGAVLELGTVDEDELYAALDLLGEAQPKIETALARRHLHDGCLVLYDLTSSYLEGQHCELGRFGYSRDGKRDKLQIVFGLLCAADGCPVAVEVFEGNAGDPSTLASRASHEAEGTLWLVPRGSGGRSRHDHRSEGPGRPRARGSRLADGAQGARDPSPGGG
jgi:hypothetical protein